MGDEHESAALQRGADTYSPNKNYEGSSKKSLCLKICAYLVLILVIVLLAVGLYFLVRHVSNTPSLNSIPDAKGFKGANSFIGFNQDNYERWTESIDKALEVYNEPCKGNCTRLPCEFPNTKVDGKPCKVQLHKFGPCTKLNNYGYSKNSPCVFLHLTDTSEWTPEYYNDTKNLPENMPKKLKQQIMNIPYVYNISLQPIMLNTIWVTCEPIASTTLEDVGPIRYFPMQGFPGYFYPEDSEGFQAPLIAIYFDKPQLNKKINVKCTTWAKNLHATKTFEFQID